ncbi:spindlin interactor and repressor of chromatin-binding protein isoform X1 [Ovis aries]|uniref:spindlin interactor and repressor of chromatin-binding protein isoform X1 n=1 Tax=Ovis aries TaxID=9940 RepID=UPI0003CD082D|nr:spindlin interactor and repressor of chromatin-binding protein isoform X1 [Ovis aries]
MLECSLWKNLLDLWSETRLGQLDVVVYLLLLSWLVPCGLQRGEKRDSRWERSFPAHTAKLGEPRSLAGVGTSTDNTFPLLSSLVAQQEKIPPPRPSLLEAGSDGSEEPKQQVSWEQEFLVGNSPGGSGRALCMVCGAEIQAPSADTARAHILEQHPHTLDLSPSEKSNILEAWSEGAALVQDFRAEQPSPHHSDSGQDSDLDPARMPAEIVVLLDSEDNPSLPRRTRPRGLRPLELPAAPVPEPISKKPRGQRCKEPSGEEPVRKKRGRPMTKTLDLDPDPDPDPPSPDSPMETFAAPAEVRHFTDGSFPAGFALQLFSHTQLRASNRRDLPKEGRGAEGGCLQPESPSPAPPPGLRGTLDLQVIRVRLEEPPAVSLLQDWSKHPQGAKGVGAGDAPDWPAALSESSSAVGAQPEAGSGL